MKTKLNKITMGDIVGADEEILLLTIKLCSSAILNRQKIKEGAIFYETRKNC